MVFSTASDAKTVVVLGATGSQGGSVVRHLLASDKPYRIKAVTRDTSKPAAQAFAKDGVELVKADLANPASLTAAFEGADIVFGVTNFWEGMDHHKELREGKAIVDAVKAAGVKLFVWSGLPASSKISGGKYTKIHHFDSKAAVTEYARESGVPTAVVMAGGYAENFLSLHMSGPHKRDGTFVFAGPATKETPYTFLNCARDYGGYVRAAIEAPQFGAGSVVYAAKEYVPESEVARIWGEINKVPAAYVQLTKEQFMAVAKSEEMMEMLLYFQDFGYFAGNDLVESNKYLAKPAQTFEEFVREADWTQILAQ